MVRVNDKELDKTVVYEYDSYGNILSKKECSYTEADVNSIVGTTVSYTYDENWKDKLTSYNGQSITYDEIGNPEIYMGAEIEWFARQMQSYEKGDLDITYKYDTDGLRTQKVVDGVEHNYYYVDGLLRIEEIKGSYTLNYRYDDRGVLTAVSSYNVNTGAVNILYAMTNTRGDVVALYDGDGDIRTCYTYDAWGKVISVTDGDGNALGANKLGSLNSIRYRGYVYDHETGLYYLQSRYYNPDTGRFLNADDVDFIGYSGEDISYNMFAYCGNNAVNFVDCAGRWYVTINIAPPPKQWYYNYQYLNNSEYTYVYEYYNQDSFVNLQFGLNYYLALLFFDDNVVRIIVSLCDPIDDVYIKYNQNNILGFVKYNLTDDLAGYVLNTYTEIYGRYLDGRTMLGIELEILLHMYLYYFEIDKFTGFGTSKSIDMGTVGVDTDGRFFESESIIKNADSLINTCKNCIITGRENLFISTITSAYILYKYIRGIFR